MRKELDDAAKARGYKNWFELEHDYGKNASNELKKDLKVSD
ncbi:hypothetical protein [Weissella viridescens]|nr:hypothetical protein [Weissella viridescens]